jgi:hypothetical protein
MFAAPRWFKRKLIMRAAAVIMVMILAGVVLLAWRWPFSREAVLKDLEEASFSKVEAGAFHGTYFPRPGCVLERVTFQHNAKPGSPPLITVQRLRIEGSFSGLFTKEVRRIRAEGLRILIPSAASGEHFQKFKRSTFVIDDLIADGAVLEVASRDPEKQPLRFSFRKFVMSDVGSNGPASFQAKLSNPEPPGEITTTGTFGPWNPDDVGKVTVSGDYLFQQADLGVFRGIAGVLSSSGKFSGTLNRIEVQGVTDVPSFTVTSSSHQVRLRTQFHAVVNGENGDTSLQRVAASFWRTTVWSQGSVAGASGQRGKTASIELSANDGRIQDILLLFVRSERAPMSGRVSFYAKVSIPPGERRFLEKVELQGDFGIDAGSFSKSATQQGVNHLSEGALGERDSHKAEKDNDKKDDNQDDEATALSDADRAKPDVSFLELDAQLFKAEVHLSDEVLEDNIERGELVRIERELRDQPSGRLRVVEGCGQGKQPIDHLPAQIEHHAMSGPRHAVLGHERSEAAQQKHRDDRDREQQGRLRVGVLQFLDDWHDHVGHDHIARRDNDHADDRQRKRPPVRADIGKQAPIEEQAG